MGDGAVEARKGRNGRSVAFAGYCRWTSEGDGGKMREGREIR